MGDVSMRRILGSAVAAAAMLAFAAPANAATIVILPEPGSMAAPRIYDVSGNPNDVYVCASMTHLASGACTLQRKPLTRR